MQIEPSKELNNYVACYGIIEGNSQNLCNKDFHIVPDGNVQLVINYEDSYVDCFTGRKLPENMLIGPLTSYRIFKAVGKVGTFLIIFYPLGITLLLNDSLTYIKEEYVSSEMLPKFIRVLKNRLLEAGDIVSRVNIANQMLGNFYRKAEYSKIKFPIDPVIKYITRVRGVVNVNCLASKFNCSVSKLERNFKELAGLTPKNYSRLIRLRNVIRLAARTDDLMDVIYSLGYYDQAHFIKEFKSYVGASPLKFLRSDKNYKRDFYKENLKERISI